MPENNATNDKKEITYHANTDASELIPSDKRLVTNIGSHRGAEDRYEIYFLVPQNDEEAQARYDCTLAYLIEAGIRQLTTRVDYPSVGFDDNGNLKEAGHEAMQVLADGYKVGAKRVAGVTQKKKAAELDQIQKNAEDVDMDDKEALARFVAGLRKSGGLV